MTRDPSEIVGALEVLDPGCPHRSKSYSDALVGVPSNARNAFVCFSILTSFPKANPTAQELMDRFGMNRATAYRYRAALMAVRGEA